MDTNSLPSQQTLVVKKAKQRTAYSTHAGTFGHAHLSQTSIGVKDQTPAVSSIMRNPPAKWVPANFPIHPIMQSRNPICASSVSSVTACPERQNPSSDKRVNCEYEHEHEHEHEHEYFVSFILSFIPQSLLDGGSNLVCTIKCTLASCRVSTLTIRGAIETGCSHELKMGKDVVEVAGKTARPRWLLIGHSSAQLHRNGEQILRNMMIITPPDQEPLDSMPCAAETRLPSVKDIQLASNGPRYKPFDLQTTVNVKGSAFTSFELSKGK
ncbi:predicted protein [Histoplasma capsulatum G186AR]|uniref:Uncharacterized protein n=1 Tax=Ajellomyces capsulatus (strain G186AR / H82 / ATCC MYA-2454 / RMSCC 2432) TaxID=447093 RepID=C0NU90_AJECG|nr:uncharacterized protein HCBG_06921 [Histoplasma capsulatum G186AR]EEH04970.1 predicted protein [Histoplasma capsulatum G186AR]